MSDFVLKWHVPGILTKSFQGYLKEPVVQVSCVKNGIIVLKMLLGTLFVCLCNF